MLLQQRLLKKKVFYGLYHNYRRISLFIFDLIGYDVKGIFRIRGKLKEVKELKQKIDSGMFISFIIDF